MKKRETIFFFLVFVSVVFSLAFYANVSFASGGGFNTTTESLEHSWFRNKIIYALTYDSTEDSIYFAGDSGVFGVYNRTSNSTEDLRSVDIGNWIGTSQIYGLTYDSNNSLIYFVGGSGVFGLYNRTSNTTENLNMTDSGDWIGANTLYRVIYSSDNKLVYIAGGGGIFGAYNRTSNTTTPVATPEAEPEAEPDSPSSSASPSIKVTSSETTTISSASPSTPAIVSISNPEIDIREMLINVKTNLSDISITVNEIDILSESDFSISTDGIIYQAFQILTDGINDTHIESVIIQYRVNKTWLNESNFTIEDVVLYRKQEVANQWDALETAYIFEDDAYYYFSSLSPGFSFFSIFVSPAECALGDKQCFENNVQICPASKKWFTSEICDYKCNGGKCAGRELFLLYLIVGIVIIGGVVSFVVKKIQEKREMEVS